MAEWGSGILQSTSCCTCLVYGGQTGGRGAGEWLFLRCSLDTAELSACCRLRFYVCFVDVVPPNPLEQISASPSSLLCDFNYTARLCGSVCRERLRIITVKCVWSPLAFSFEMEIAALVSSSGPQVIVPPVPLAASLPLHGSAVLMTSLLYLSKRLFLHPPSVILIKTLVICCSSHCQQVPLFNDSHFYPLLRACLALAPLRAETQFLSFTLWVPLRAEWRNKRSPGSSLLHPLLRSSSLFWHGQLKVVSFGGGWLAILFTVLLFLKQKLAPSSPIIVLPVAHEDGEDVFLC